MHYAPFFYPLDAVGHWNRLYGKRGFYQYQCVIPTDDAPVVIEELLKQIARAGAGSFLSVLKMDNKPLDALRHKSTIWDHFTVSFIATVDIDLLVELQNETSLKIYSQAGRKEYVAILSGTITEWHDACCSISGTPEFEELLNKILGHLKRVGFREVFAYG